MIITRSSIYPRGRENKPNGDRVACTTCSCLTLFDTSRNFLRTRGPTKIANLSRIISYKFLIIIVQKITVIIIIILSFSSFFFFNTIIKRSIVKKNFIREFNQKFICLFFFEFWILP